jgi:hypothetical protein
MAEPAWDHYSDLPSPAAYQEQPYITLTHAEWTRIHNALCRAESMYQSVFDILKNGPEMREALDEIRMSLAPAYSQDTDAFDCKMNYYRQHQENSGFESIWSVYEVSADSGFFNLHPWQGANVLVYGNVTVKIPGPTWGDLYRAADEAIDRSEDYHHIFIEGFARYGEDKSRLELTTGS